MKRKPTGPMASTKRGTVVEVIRHLGCRDLLVMDEGGSTGVCSADSLSGLTAQDIARIAAILEA